jgi:hypothetical protein
MECAFAASAAVTSGDQEKCVRIGELMSEGHMSSNLLESPNKLSGQIRPGRTGRNSREEHTSNRRSALRTR